MDIRIYVANLAAYNDGRLVGEWIDLPIDADELQAKLDEIAGEHGDELAIHDYEAPWKIGEYDNITEINELAERYAEVDEDEFEAIAEATGYDASEILDIIDSGDYTIYDGDLSDVAEQMVDEGLFGEIPESIARYIDYEAIGRDLGYDGYTEVTLRGGKRIVVHVSR